MVLTLVHGKHAVVHQGRFVQASTTLACVALCVALSSPPFHPAIAKPRSERVITMPVLDASGLSRAGLAFETMDTALGVTAAAVNATLVEGESGELVDRLQDGLYGLGYLTKGQLSGIYDSYTKQALARFFWANGLDEPGAVTEKILPALSDKDAVHASVIEGLDFSTSPEVIRFLANVRQKRNSSYALGHEGPRTFDCSGFVYYALRSVGVKTGRSNALGYSQNGRWKGIGRIGDLRPGDLMFFKSEKEDEVNHAGIYLGNGKFIHASSSKKKVVISPVSAYWRRNFVVGRRVSL